MDTKFKKGNTAGKKRGPNKVSKTVKETVLAVFLEIQSNPKVKLLQFAKDYPKEFYSIAAKLIPTEITADIAANITTEPTIIIWGGKHIKV